MNKFGRFYLIMGVVALAFALPLMAQQEQEAVDPITTVTTVHWMADDSVVEEAEATLTRMEHGIAMSFDTVGLEPGDVVTIWWVIFDAPENCSDGQCSMNDVFLMNGAGKFILDGNGQRQPNRAGREAAQISNLWAAGTLVDDAGTARFQGHLPIGDTTGDTLFGSTLQNPMSAEIHLIARTHGPVQPALLHEQLLTGWGGCPDPLNRAPCEDIQVAYFKSPD